MLYVGLVGSNRTLLSTHSTLHFSTPLALSASARGVRQQYSLRLLNTEHVALFAVTRPSLASRYCVIHTAVMTSTCGRLASWFRRHTHSASSLRRLASTARTNRSFHSPSFASSLSAAARSPSATLPIYRQPQPVQSTHRCSAACHDHASPVLFNRLPATRTVMSAIDSLTFSASSSASAPSLLSLLSPLSLPLSAPAASPVADVPLECAVPKRKPSPRAQRHRRAGQRATHARRLHQTYRICLNCGSPVKPHYLCIRCRQVIGRF